MKQPWFKKEITVGTLLQLATLLVLATAAHFKIEARMEMMERATISNTNRLDRHESAINSMANTMTKFETLIDERTRPKL